MEKLNEAQILARMVIPYLQSLGYPSQLIRDNIRTNQGRVADIVVYRENDEPFIVVEVKTADRALPAKDENELRYDPVVRQVHLYAKELKAPYMLLSNGTDHYWFVSDSTGRPKLLNEPVPYLETHDVLPSISKVAWLTTALTRLRELEAYSNQNNIPIVLMAKLMSEREGTSIIAAWSKLESMLLRNNGFAGYIGRTTETYIQESMRIIAQLSLNEYSDTELLGAIDKIVINPQFRKTWLRVNRWLADFMVRLGKINATSRILDIACGLGDILAAAKMTEFRLEANATLGVSKNGGAALWALLQEYILGQNLENISVGDPLVDINKPSNLSHIIFAPPFGGKLNDHPLGFDLFEYGVRNIEDLYLERAIKLLPNEKGRIVALVPEGLLFTGGRREYTRQYLMSKMRITAIIGLSSGVLSPYSGIKSSILVLDRKPVTEPYEVFMAQIDSLPQLDTFNSYDLPQVSEVLAAFDSWSQASPLKSTDNVWTKESIALTPENFTTNFYRKSVDRVESFSRHETVPLKDVTTHIGRGRAIKLNDVGNIPVVGPAAIRALAIEEDGIQKTTEENVPSNPVLIQAGDILLNNIGTYLGQSAVADKALEGINLSQHVILIKANLELVDRDYLAIALNSEFVREQFRSKATGTMMPSLTKTSLETTLIPLPPLDAQKHIVKRVLAIKTKLDSNKRETKRLEGEFSNLTDDPFAEESDQ